MRAFAEFDQRCSALCLSTGIVDRGARGSASDDRNKHEAVPARRQPLAATDVTCQDQIRFDGRRIPLVIPQRCCAEFLGTSPFRALSRAVRK
jgi:hypothetical protein